MRCKVQTCVFATFADTHAHRALVGGNEKVYGERGRIVDGPRRSILVDRQLPAECRRSGLPTGASRCLLQLPATRAFCLHCVAAGCCCLPQITAAAAAAAGAASCCVFQAPAEVPAGPRHCPAGRWHKVQQRFLVDIFMCDVCHAGAGRQAAGRRQAAAGSSGNGSISGCCWSWCLCDVQVGCYYAGRRARLAGATKAHCPDHCRANDILWAQRDRSTKKCTQTQAAPGERQVSNTRYACCSGNCGSQWRTSGNDRLPHNSSPPTHLKYDAQVHSWPIVVGDHHADAAWRLACHLPVADADDA